MSDIHCIAFDRDEDSLWGHCTYDHSTDEHEGTLGSCVAAEDDEPAAEHQARLAAESTTCPICVGSGTYFSEEAGDEGGEIVTCVTCRGSGRLAAEPKETP